MRFSLYLGLLVYIGTVLPLYAQDIIALQERLIAKQEDYQIQTAKLREANQKVTHLTGEVRVAQAAVENATKTMEQAWEQLSSKFQLLRLHPTISIEEERKHYGDAKQTVTERESQLANLQHELTQAERDAATAHTVLDGMKRDREAIERMVNEARFNALQPHLEREQIVEVRGEAGCGNNQSIVECQQHALERALQQASEQGSATLISSATTVKNFELTQDEIRTQVKALVLHHDVLDEGFVGKSGYYYHIRAVVKGQISAALRRQYLGDDAPATEPAAANWPRGELTTSPRYKLTIHPTPADSQIRIMNISPKYHPGIELAPGQYDVVVERSGYRSVRQWVAIVHTDIEIDIQLSRQTAATRRQETNGFLGGLKRMLPR
jgi:hypothetical protein